jgi:hypothetical protein
MNSGYTPSHILSERNQTSLGTSFLSQPIIAVGGETFIESVVGPRFNLAADKKWDYHQYQLAVNAYPINNVIGGTKTSWYTYFLEMTFFSNLATFGQAEEPPPTPPFALGPTVPSIQPTVRVDCTSSIITIPVGGAIQGRFIQRVYSRTAFAAGDRVAPQMRTNLGFGYGTPKSIQTWYSDIPQDMAINDTCYWSKPQFAEGITLNLVPQHGATLDGITGRLDVSFFAQGGAAIRTVPVRAPLGSAPVIHWPQNAFYVQVKNHTDADLFVSITHALSL